ncbi:MAG: carbohydrate kinase, partial [Halanaerobacter sp.]
AEPKFVVPYFKHTDKILDEEVETLDDYIEAGRRLQEEGAEYVMIPFHCDRLIFNEEGVYSVSAKDFCLLNWLGAGEAYNAAFLDYILNNDFDFIEANRYAGAAALVIAEERDIFIQDREEIKDILPKLKVERVK